MEKGGGVGRWSREVEQRGAGIAGGVGTSPRMPPSRLQSEGVNIVDVLESSPLSQGGPGVGATTGPPGPPAGSACWSWGPSGWGGRLGDR